ncbi:MAG: FAD-dependent oxidoreductase, partial [Clostridia bacterium]|nr:FAD-dependent oxidoreductase [Clostridia bacterium]
MRTDFDVIVCGGGIAGIAAALAAAREGTSVCLLEKEYCLGGLATLGLIVIYLPLCDGDGVLMSGGIAEELALASLKYGPGTIPEVWKHRDTTTPEERAGKRYEIRYQAAPMMLAAEELLLDAGVTLYYDARLAAAETDGTKVTAVTVDTKRGPVKLTAKAFIDATGDADLCAFAGEKTVEFAHNSRTGWYFSFDGTTG